MLPILQTNRMKVSRPMYNTTTECVLDDQTVLNAEGEESICNEPDIKQVDAYNSVTHILLALYMVIAHVMLLNLLIAIFT